MSDKPFFIGWEDRNPHSSWLRKTIAAVLVGAAIVAGLTAAFQQTIGSGIFEFGKKREFQGVLLRSPTPLLISDHPVEGRNLFYLVNPLKHGLPENVAVKHHLRRVKIKGALIQNDQGAMIEVAAIHAEEQTPVANTLATAELADSVTVTGEIVDSKCHLGVMNPGRFKAHRACAIQCIRGGIPPILVAQTPEGVLGHYLLVGPNGEPLNDQILGHVALPVAVTGRLKRIGDRLALYTDPSSIKRL